MRIFMLGWEFPPFISGGLGTACYGLTKALSEGGHHVTFVLPKTVDSDYTSHVKLLSPQAPSPRYEAGPDGETADDAEQRPAEQVASRFAMDTPTLPGEAEDAFENVDFRAVPSRLSNPYDAGAGVGQVAVPPAQRGIGFITPHADYTTETERRQQAATPGRPGGGPGPAKSEVPTQESFGGGDLMVEAQRYAQLCVALASAEDFDVIHAHDWFTFPAGMAVARATGKPLVVHVHSTEFDRSGDHAHQVIYQIERDGTQAAARVIAVSRRTKLVLTERYGVDAEKIEVVYNGVLNGPTRPDIKIPPKIDKDDKIVLFLGRVTMQKGPEYFIQAAKRVLEKMQEVKFVVAGTGDKIQEMIEMVAQAGIGHKVVFTGFLRGSDVERVFKMADVYVMPSVSEPFGIAPLEAISHDVPVIMSKQSGVSEVIEHALKVDFWDTDEMANKIIAVLRHPPLGATLREHADLEVRRLTWSGAAEKCAAVYGQLV